MPSATICASVITTVAIDDRHDQGERHAPGAGRGPRRPGPARPRSRRRRRSAGARSSRTRAGTACGRRSSRDTSTAKRPATMKITSGVSLPTVRTFSTRLLCRMPRTLIAAIAAMIDGNRRGAGPAPRHRGPVEPERADEHVDHRGPARDAREPLHPADFEGGEPAERGASVEIGPAGPFEAAADLGEAERDQHRRATRKCRSATGSTCRRSPPALPAARRRRRQSPG